jgi:hypothetical protein
MALLVTLITVLVDISCGLVLLVSAFFFLVFGGFSLPGDRQGSVLAALVAAGIAVVVLDCLFVPNEEGRLSVPAAGGQFVLNPALDVGAGSIALALGNLAVSAAMFAVTRDG